MIPPDASSFSVFPAVLSSSALVRVSGMMIGTWPWIVFIIMANEQFLVLFCALMCNYYITGQFIAQLLHLKSALTVLLKDTELGK